MKRGREEGAQSMEFWQSNRGERWVRRQPFEQLIRTFERLKQQSDTNPRVDGGMSSRRAGIELIREELDRRRDERIRQDQLHAPLDEEPQHLLTTDGQSPVDIPEVVDGEGDSLEVDLLQVR